MPLPWVGAQSRQVVAYVKVWREPFPGPNGPQREPVGPSAMNGAATAQGRAPFALGRHPQRILEVLAVAPGLNIDEISALLGIRRTSTNHHLRVLMGRALVVQVRQGRHALHFLAGESPILRKAVKI